MMIGVVVVVSAPDPHQRRTPSNMCFMATNMGDSSERASELVRVGRVVASGDSGTAGVQRGQGDGVSDRVRSS